MRLCEFIDVPPEVKNIKYETKTLTVGLELECEDIPCNNDNLICFPMWEQVRDGSLRGSYPYEFRLIQPLPYVSAREELENLLFMLSRLKISEEEEMKRCSFQISVNCLGMEEQEFISFIAMYIFLEPLLFSILPKHKNNNLFCVPVRNNINFIYAITKKNVPKESIFSTIDRESNKFYKYQALNIRNLLDRGFVEIRMFPASLDKEELLWYMEIINYIYYTSFFMSACPYSYIAWSLKDKDKLTSLKKAFKFKGGDRRLKKLLREGAVLAHKFLE